MSLRGTHTTTAIHAAFWAVPAEGEASGRMRLALRPRHSLLASVTPHLRLLTLFVMLSILLPRLQVIGTAILALILQALQVWLQTAGRQLYSPLAKARHRCYWWRVHVSARSPTMWTLLYLAIAKLSPLKLQDAFFTDHFFTLIAHLSVI